MIPLSRYAKVKDKYCIYYAGPIPEHLAQILEIRSHIEKELPGLKIYIVCKDSLLYVVERAERIYPQSKLAEIKEQFSNFAIRQLKYDLTSNPIEALLMESDLKESLSYFHKEILPKQLEKLLSQNK